MLTDVGDVNPRMPFFWQFLGNFGCCVMVSLVQIRNGTDNAEAGDRLCK
jgi:hypothetical protein